MSDMEKDIEEFDEDEANYITLTDDDGNDISFEILDTRSVFIQVIFTAVIFSYLYHN